MDDLISRQKAIDALMDAMNDVGVLDAEDINTVFQMLPSTQLERIKGHWIYHPEWANDGECGYECSVCHMGSDVDYNFCMRCGADMRGVAE